MLTPFDSRCGSVETCRKATAILRAVRESTRYVQVCLESVCMATVTLKNVKKIYPHAEETKKKPKKGEVVEEKKVNLQITEKGVVAVQEFNLEIADKEFIVLVGPSG